MRFLLTFGNRQDISMELYIIDSHGSIHISNGLYHHLTKKINLCTAGKLV